MRTGPDRDAIAESRQVIGERFGKEVAYDDGEQRKSCVH